MRVLLAGVAGFIGSNLAKRLLLEGHEVIGIDNLVTGRLENLEGLLKNQKFSFYEKDVIEPFEYSGRIDWVLHFASPASPPKYISNSLLTLRSNSEGTYQLLELAKSKNAKFLFTSTSEVYGDPDTHPQSEEYWGNVNPIGERSVYDESKRFAEALIMNYRRNFNMSTRIIRIFNTYGPNMDPDDGRVITNFIMQALRGQPITIYGSGEQTRSFQFIDDLVEAIVRLMKVEYYEPINIGNPEEYTINELAYIVSNLTGIKLETVNCPIPKDDPRKRKPNIQLAKKLLNWEPITPLEVGLQHTIEYLKTYIQLCS